jgi:tetratricopeptide (TPR) repeat protein
MPVEIVMNLKACSRALATATIVTALSAWTLCSPAFAASEGARKLCINEGGHYPADDVIFGCDAVIADNSHKYEHAWMLGNRAWALVRKGEFDAALADQTKAIQLSDHPNSAYVARGHIYLAKGDREHALEDYNTSIAVDPKYGYGHHARANFYNGSGDFPRALADYNTAIEQSATHDRYFDRGNYYRSQGDLGKAIADYSAAIAAWPWPIVYFNERASAYEANGDQVAALNDYKKIVELPATSAMDYAYRGYALYRQDQADAAIAELDHAVRLAPSNAYAYHLRAAAWRAKGELARSLDDIRQAVRLAPENTDYVVGLGITLYAAGKFQDAMSNLPGHLPSTNEAYAMLFRYLAQERVGEPGTNQLQQSAALLKGKGWPYPLISLYLGQSSSKEAMDSAKSANEQCEAHFYVGQLHLLQKQLTQATAEMKTAAGSCAHDMYEYATSIAELARLKQ